MPAFCRKQRKPVGGSPRVVHGLRAAQPGGGDDSRSPQPGQRWATGGQPGVVVVGARTGSCAAPLNACGVEADACEPAAIGRRTWRAAELRCSGRDDTVRQDREESPLRARRDRETEPTCSPSRRRHGACRVGSAARHSAAPLCRPASAAPATSGRPWPSPLNTSLRSSPLGVLPRECVHPLRACTKPCPAGAQRVRCRRTPCTPAAPLSGRSPPPRVARSVRALWIGSRARSRGSRPAVDITRDYAQASCLSGAARGVLPRESPRPRNPSLCQRPSSTSVCSPRCRAPGAALLQHPARAARVCAPSLACRLRPACRGGAWGWHRGSGQAVATRSKAKSGQQARSKNHSAQRGRYRRIARCCRRSVAPCSPRQCQALRVATRALTRLRAALGGLRQQRSTPDRGPMEILP